ncbi:MAG: rod shape-determining protein MreD [Candidatus Enterenecus sp.]
MTRRDFIIKCLAYGAALAVIAVLNYSVLSRLPISLPLLLPMAAVAVGTLEGPRFGAGFGLAAGLAQSALAHASLLCVPLLSALGWGCGMLALFVLRRDLVGHLICSLGAMVLWELFQVGRRWLGGVAALPVLLKVALPELLWTLLLSLAVYWICRFCCLHYGRIYHE